VVLLLTVSGVLVMVKYVMLIYQAKLQSVLCWVSFDYHLSVAVVPASL